MHRLAAIAGGWEVGSSPEGGIFIEQTPAPFVILTAADTDIQLFAKAIEHPRKGVEAPLAVRVASLLQLQQQLTIDTYAETVLSHAQGILIRLLGGRGYWSYGLEVVREVVERTGAVLIVVPGDDRPDLELMSHSTVSLKTVEQVWRYFTEGGVENYGRAIQALYLLHTGTDNALETALIIPKVGLYNTPIIGLQSRSGQELPILGRAGILFYRAHYLAGNTDAIDALCKACSARGLTPIPVFVDSLSIPQSQAEVLALFQDGIDVLINTLSFSVAKIGAAELNLDLWQSLDVPILQAICRLKPWRYRLEIWRCM
jgi:cobaltochelatase CobN